MNLRLCFWLVCLILCSCRGDQDRYFSFSDIPESLEQELQFNDVNFRVSVKGTGSLKKLTIIINSPELKDTLIRIVNGNVYSVKTGDLNNNKLPELYAFVIGRGSQAKGSFLGFEFGSDEVVELVLPEPNPKLMEGYFGHDSLYIRGKHLVRQFPIFSESGFSYNPTSSTRVIEYSLDDSHPYKNVRLLDFEKSYVK
jgi:hypothetical protein